MAGGDAPPEPPPRPSELRPDKKSPYYYLSSGDGASQAVLDAVQSEDNPDAELHGAVSHLLYGNFLVDLPAPLRRELRKLEEPHRAWEPATDWRPAVFDLAGRRVFDLMLLGECDDEPMTADAVYAFCCEAEPRDHRNTAATEREISL